MSQGHHPDGAIAALSGIPRRILLSGFERSPGFEQLLGFGTCVSMTDIGSEFSLKKQPQQARARAVVDAILEAAAQILERQGLRAVNTNAIALRAGVSIGTLYQYFASKEAVLAELLRRERLGLRAGLAEALDRTAGAPLETCVHALLAAGIAHQIDRPQLANALEYVERLLPLDQEADALAAEIAAGVAERLGALGVPEPFRADRDLTAMARGMIDAAGLAGESDAEALLDRLLPASLGYLRAAVSGDLAPSARA